MPIVTSATDAFKNQRQVHVNGREYTLSEFVGAMPLRGHYQEGSESNDNGLPQGFLVTQPPGAVTPAHFHEPNQFQVFVDGSGRIGARAAPPLSVQYANGHTPYGPIVAGPEGLKYFTLRQQWDPGAKYVPASLPKLRKGSQRTRMAAGLNVADDAERKARTSVTVETVFEPEADGLAAYIYRAGANQCVKSRLPDAREGGGQYLLVAGGTIRHGGAELPKWSTVFVPQRECPPSLEAGNTGVDLLVLQFPQRATR
jgi:hypothetical protein